MNVLTLAREAAAVVSTDQPDTLFDKNNAQSQLFLSLLNDSLDSLKRFGNWQQLQQEGSFFILDQCFVYPIEEVAPDFFTLVPDTIFIKDSKEKIIGSVSAEEFMKSKVFKTRSGEISFYLKKNAFHFTALPPVGSRVIFQYRTKNTVKEKSPQTGETLYKERPTKDTDEVLFDPYLVKLSLIWRWYKRNSFAYEEEFQEYMSEVKKAFSENLTLQNISLCASYFNFDLGGPNVRFVQKKGC